MTRQQSVAILLPNMRGGGAERVVVNLANAFVTRGFAVDVVLLVAGGELQALLDSRVRVVDLGVKRMRHLFAPLRRYLQQRKPDALLACMWPLTVIAVAARMAARVPVRVVVAEHINWAVAKIGDKTLQQRPLTRRLLRTTMWWAFPHAAAVVCVSRGAAVDLAKVSRFEARRITTIYNPIVDSNAATLHEPPGTPVSWCTGDHRRILAVGTLKDIKDYPLLFRALVKVRESVDARLLILGEGRARPSLEALLATLPIARYVSMPGFVPDTAPYFAHADLHVLSSMGEGFGNVIVEALDAGTPVVSTDCPSGPAEILDGGRYGRLVPVGNADALAEAMLDALAETPDREALHRRAREFSIDRAADLYLDLLLPAWRQA
ncbi:glycosyltransferase [Luteimonas sp. MC1825]|uniref:glycosyltransferase n=1 Tax=Luteimonas sp. MC1825 TaxID=2761107 RepID=UPI0016210C59|nr:glycosyltransferase [Luteimonas sp. MC1825]MBB6599048.1 glycosyltransferase [Luteimonas sp. MC1825]QOC89181.1 glycosyltransferase [Luteimonas sp. MC1825]